MMGFNHPFQRGARNGYHVLSRGWDLNRRPPERNPQASALDRSAIRPRLYTLLLYMLMVKVTQSSQMTNLTAEELRLILQLSNLTLYDVRDAATPSQSALRSNGMTSHSANCNQLNNQPTTDAGVWPSGLARWLVDFDLAVVGSNPSHG